MLLFFVLVGFVWGLPHDNIRASIGDDHIQGYAMFSLLKNEKPDVIMASIKTLMREMVPPQNRLKIIVDAAVECSTKVAKIPGNKEVTWREARLHAAQENLQRYQANPFILDNIIAIDELTVIQGKLDVIVASVKNRFLDATFIKEGSAKADGAVVLNFLKRIKPRAESAKIREPILLWDNIAIHKTEEIAGFLENNGWSEIAHPVGSPDMNPLDASDFKDLMKKYRELGPETDPDLAQKKLQAALVAINNENRLEGVVKLPSIWQSLVRTAGLETRSQCSAAESCPS